MNEFYYHESAQFFEWNLRNNFIYIRRLHYHLILEYLNIENNFYQWQRSITEINNLNDYNAFITEIAA
jgi:hypothetical protein